MRATLSHGILAFVVAAALPAWAQTPLPGEAQQAPPSPAVESATPISTSPLPIPPVPMAAVPVPAVAAAPVTPTVQELLNFKQSDVKFDLRDLMETLSDRRHEGWVLAAYPDPKTSRPLIGAGFSLDLPAREHLQRDPLNPHPFLEPASAELWQAAGLNPQRLQVILDRYERNLAAWKKKRFRKKIATLSPQITDEEANQLLRVAAIQAIYNAKAYCRNFDRYSASQQMALSQLVYQMGVNLEEFSQFLTLINSDSAAPPLPDSAATPDSDYWKAVQASLIQSQWARLYRVRAVSVVAMLDPQYADGPARAERLVSATLRPAGVRRRKGRAAASLRAASLHERAPRGRPQEEVPPA